MPLMCFARRGLAARSENTTVKRPARHRPRVPTGSRSKRALLHPCTISVWPRRDGEPLREARFPDFQAHLRSTRQHRRRPSPAPSAASTARSLPQDLRSFPGADAIDHPQSARLRELYKPGNIAARTRPGCVRPARSTGGNHRNESLRLQLLPARAFFLLPLPQPDTRAATILVDELHPARLQRTADSQVIGARQCRLVLL